VARLAVAAYPLLSADDRQWIEQLRARHDPRAASIAAHLTLVFPAEVAEGSLVAHVGTALRGCGPIRLTLGSAAVLPDAAGGGCHYVCLRAEEGRRELRALRERLHEGALARLRDAAISFEPHVTVGAHPERAECERLARCLDDQGRIVRASIASVDVLAVEGTAVRTVAVIPLRAPGGAAPRDLLRD
jgi:2'-5' RNA ligase